MFKVSQHRIRFTRSCLTIHENRTICLLIRATKLRNYLATRLIVNLEVRCFGTKNVVRSELINVWWLYCVSLLYNAQIREFFCPRWRNRRNFFAGTVHAPCFFILKLFHQGPNSNGHLDLLNFLLILCFINLFHDVKKLTKKKLIILPNNIVGIFIIYIFCNVSKIKFLPRLIYTWCTIKIRKSNTRKKKISWIFFQI